MTRLFMTREGKCFYATEEEVSYDDLIFLAEYLGYNPDNCYIEIVVTEV